MSLSLIKFGAKQVVCRGSLKQEPKTMGLLTDRDIKRLCSNEDESENMISPFIDHLESTVKIVLNKPRAISYGLTSVGYDIRLADEIKICRPVETMVSAIDPKDFIPDNLFSPRLFTGTNGTYFILPGNCSALGKSIESFNMPEDVSAVCVGKSTYARSFIQPLITPLEPGWKGTLTIEVANQSPLPCKVYVNEGIAQLMFTRTERPDVTYADRKGKFMNQPDEIVYSKV